MTGTLNIAALKACNLFASKEPGRFYLNGVFVTVTARATTYVATDSHRLLAHREPLADDAESNDCLGEWILPFDAIAKLKATKYETAITLAPFGDGKLLLGETNVTPIDGTFPDWRRILPAPVASEGHERPQFNMAYLHDFQKAAVLLGYEATSPFLHYDKVNDPTAVTFGHENTFGVIMPVRNSQPLWAGAPSWVSESAAQTAQAAIARATGEA